MLKRKKEKNPIFFGLMKDFIYLFHGLLTTSNLGLNF